MLGGLIYPTRLVHMYKAHNQTNQKNIMLTKYLFTIGTHVTNKYFDYFVIHNICNQIVFLYNICE